MFNYEKAKELINEAREIGPGHEYAMKMAINSIYGAGYVDTDSFDDASMYKREMCDDCMPRNSGRYPWKTDGYLNLGDRGIVLDLEDDIKCHMMNVYGIKNPKVTVNEHNEVTIDIHDGDYYITKVIFNDPATIVFWSDGTKTVVKCCEDDTFDKEKGLAMAVCKKVSGNDSKRFHRGMRAWIKPEPALNFDTMSRLFASWGEIVNSAINNIVAHNRLREKEEKGYEIICPCCDNHIKMPSRHEFYKNGGHTRCPNCGLEIHITSKTPCAPERKEDAEFADKLADIMHASSKNNDSPEEEKTCRPENTEK